MTPPERCEPLIRAALAVAVLFDLILVAAVVHRFTEDPVSPQLVRSTRASSLPLPVEPRLLILGDSYTEGYALDPPRGYAHDVAARLGWESRVDGVGGTGFTTPGPGRYDRRIERTRFVPDLLLLEGGQNDQAASPTELRAAVVDTIEVARDRWPTVQVIVFGPMGPFPLADRLVPFGNAIGRGAEDAGAAFINPLAEEWISRDTSAQYAAPDGSHLNPAGHGVVAARVAERVEALTVVSGR